MKQNANFEKNLIESVASLFYFLLNGYVLLLLVVLMSNFSFILNLKTDIFQVLWFAPCLFIAYVTYAIFNRSLNFFGTEFNPADKIVVFTAVATALPTFLKAGMSLYNIDPALDLSFLQFFVVPIICAIAIHKGFNKK